VCVCVSARVFECVTNASSCKCSHRVDLRGIASAPLPCDPPPFWWMDLPLTRSPALPLYRSPSLSLSLAQVDTQYGYWVIHFDMPAATTVAFHSIVSFAGFKPKTAAGMRISNNRAHISCTFRYSPLFLFLPMCGFSGVCFIGGWRIMTTWHSWWKYLGATWRLHAPPTLHPILPPLDFNYAPLRRYTHIVFGRGRGRKA